MRSPAFLAAAGLLALGACHRGGNSGPGHAAAARDFPASGFDRVALAGPDDVVVKVGGAASVHAVGDQAVLDRLRIEVVDGELRVGRNEGPSLGHERHDTTITVTVPTLAGVTLVGAGDMKVSGPNAPNFIAELSGAGDLDIDGIKASHAELTLSGTGKITAAGTTGSARLTSSGTGSIDAERLAAGTVDAALRGVGDIDARASASATIVAAGTGDVTIRGTRSCAITKSGLGDVDCKE